METPDGITPPFDVGDQLSARLAQLGQEHCVFLRNGQLYAVAVGTAREVLIGESITSVPQAPEALIGVLNLRGEVLPLLRLDTLLDLPARPYLAADDQVLVLSCGGTDLGVIVDRVREVRPIDPKQITAIPAEISAHRLFKGCWEGPSGRVIILDADGLVAAAVALVTRGFRERRGERQQTGETK
ncbi:MAG TPA: chemotaxis protein CheW [Candidatus Acidoferrales bacterium]|nr:chemotaxis protein CheW [Candidatus Acidoferrales bacterium]